MINYNYGHQYQMGSYLSTNGRECLDKREARLNALIAADKLKVQHDEFMQIKHYCDELVKIYNKDFDAVAKRYIEKGKSLKSCKFIIWCWSVYCDPSEFDMEKINKVDYYETLGIMRVQFWKILLHAAEHSSLGIYRKQLFLRLNGIVPGTYKVEGNIVTIEAS